MVISNRTSTTNFNDNITLTYSLEATKYFNDPSELNDKVVVSNMSPFVSLIITLNLLANPTMVICSFLSDNERVDWSAKTQPRECYLH